MAKRTRAVSGAVKQKLTVFPSDSSTCTILLQDSEALSRKSKVARIFRYESTPNGLRMSSIRSNALPSRSGGWKVLREPNSIERALR